MFELVYPLSPVTVVPLPTAERPSNGKEIRPGEMVPIVEQSGLVVGEATRKYVHGGSKLLHPVVHLHIINREGLFYLQKRGAHKDLLPGMWDTAVGGHVDFGEQLEEALIREAGEELGLFDFHAVYLMSYVYESGREKELVNVYGTVGNYRLTPANGEVSGGKWWTPDEIEAAVGKGILTPNFEGEFPKVRHLLEALL